MRKIQAWWQRRADDARTRQALARLRNPCRSCGQPTAHYRERLCTACALTWSHLHSK